MSDVKNTIIQKNTEYNFVLYRVGVVFVLRPPRQKLS